MKIRSDENAAVLNPVLAFKNKPTSCFQEGHFGRKCWRPLEGKSINKETTWSEFNGTRVVKKSK